MLTCNEKPVNDLFFDYERGQKLGLWVLAIDSGLLLGPTCKSWRFISTFSMKNIDMNLGLSLYALQLEDSSMSSAQHG